MPLADKLDSSLKQYKAKQQFCAAIKVALTDSLSEKDVEAYKTVLENTNTLDPEYLPSTRLSIILRQEGLRVSTSSLERHRNKTCTCYKAGL